MNKKRIFSGLTAAIILAGSLFAFGACDLFDSLGGNQSSENVNGTYYLYEGGKLNKSASVTLNDGEWTCVGGEFTSGTYTISSGIIKFSVYEELIGGNRWISSGVIDRGGLEFRSDTYYKEGCQRSDILQI